MRGLEMWRRILFAGVQGVLFVIGLALLVTPWREAKCDFIVYSIAGLGLCLLAVFARQQR